MKFSTKHWFPLFSYLIIAWTGICIFGLIVFIITSPLDFIEFSFKSAHNPEATKSTVIMCIVSIIIGLPISLKIIREI